MVRRLWSEDDVSHDGPLFQFEHVTRAAASAPVATRGLAGRNGAERAGTDGAVGRGLAAEPVHAGRSGGRPGRRSNDAPPSSAGRSTPSISGSASAMPKGTCRRRGSRRSRGAGQRSTRARLVPIGLPALRTLLQAYIDAGCSKFVRSPAGGGARLAGPAGRAGRARPVAPDLTVAPVGVDEDAVRELVARLPGTEARSHFGHPDFRVKNRIFATLWPADHRCNVRLPHALALEVVEADPETHRLISERGHIGWVGVDLARHHGRRPGWPARAGLAPCAPLPHRAARATVTWDGGRFRGRSGRRGRRTSATG